MKYLHVVLLGLTLVACGKGAGTSAFKQDAEQFSANIEPLPSIEDLASYNPLAQKFEAPTKSLANKRWKRNGSCHITYNLGMDSEVSFDADNSKLCRVDLLSFAKKTVATDEVTLNYYNFEKGENGNGVSYLTEMSGDLLAYGNEVGNYDDDHLYYYFAPSGMQYPMHLYLTNLAAPVLTLYQIDRHYNPDETMVESVTKITMQLK